MGNIWKEKVYAERVRQMRMMKTKQTNVSAEVEPQVGRQDGAECHRTAGGSCLPIPKAERPVPDTGFWKRERKQPQAPPAAVLQRLSTGKGPARESCWVLREMKRVLGDWKSQMTYR